MRVQAGDDVGRWQLEWRAWTIRTIVILCGLALGTFEVISGGGRPAVLTFCLALIGSPFIDRLDAYRRTIRTREASGDPRADD